MWHRSAVRGPGMQEGGGDNLSPCHHLNSLPGQVHKLSSPGGDKLQRTRGTLSSGELRNVVMDENIISMSELRSV